MKKQFFRVKQLADQTFLKADKSEVLNHEELHTADQKVEYLRSTLSAIIKRIPQSGPSNDVDKRAKKSMEHHLATVFIEQTLRKNEPVLPEDECRLFQSVLRDCGMIEQNLAKEYADHEKQVEELVSVPIQNLLDNEFPNILKQKRNLSKYILDKDSASNRYHSTKREALKDDMEEADNKVEQSRDVLAYEMFSLLAKENDLSGYILQLLKCQRAYHDSALKHLQEMIPELEKRIGDSPVKRVYGISLDEHLRVTDKTIAYPLEICVTILSKIGLSEEGLFRIAGGTARIKRLKSSIDSGCFTCLIPEYQDVHVLASALKMYLRELPDPLLTSKLYDRWMQTMHRPEHQRLEHVRHLVDKLPATNRANLSFLIHFLAKLSRYPENKMTSSNIAIVMAPNLLWNNREAPNINMEDCGTINMLVELFIKEVDHLFPDDYSKSVQWTLDEEFTTFSHNKSLQSVDFNVSSENINVSDSPKPNSRKKKPAAPVPPVMTTSSRTDQDIVVQGDKMSMSYPSGSSTLNRPAKHKITKSTNTGDFIHEPAATVAPSLVSSGDGPSDKSAAGGAVVVVTQSAQVQVSKAKPVTPVVAQTIDHNQSVNHNNFKTTVVHNVIDTSPKPVAAPRSIDLTRSSSIKIDLVKSGHDEGLQLRRTGILAKPEVPARPASLMTQQQQVKRSSGEDPVSHIRTQCSVYSVANKQQPSYVNLQNKNNYQPGHDHQITEKEKFLGHHNHFNKPGLPPKSSHESLECGAEAEVKVFTSNGHRQHTRTRSDGNLIELGSGGGENSTSSPTSPRAFGGSGTVLNKPTQPPPPPPVASPPAGAPGGGNIIASTTKDSTDL